MFGIDRNTLILIAAVVVVVYLSAGTSSAAVASRAQIPVALGRVDGTVQPATVIGSIDGAHCAKGAKLDPTGTMCVPLCDPGTSYNAATDSCKAIVFT